MFPVLTPHRGRVSVQKSSVDEFKLVSANLIRMGIQMSDFIGKLLRIFDLIGNPLSFRSIVQFFGHLEGDIP
jgi:hypothetical protein